MAQDTSQTVERALRVLRTFSRDCPAIAPADLSRSLGLPRTIVLRILNTLEQSGFVERVPGDSRYRLGVTALEVGALYAETNSLLASSDEALASLVARTGYTAYLGVLQGQDAVILSLHEGHHPVRFIWSIGDRLPATTTALGKAILVHTAPEVLDDTFGTAGLPGLTDRSLATRSDLDRDLEMATRRGWASTEDESQLGVSAVGAAIFDPADRPVAGVSVSFLDYPPDPSRVEHLGRLVREVAHTITVRVVTYSVFGQRSIQRAPIRTRYTTRAETRALPSS